MDTHNQVCAINLATSLTVLNYYSLLLLTEWCTTTVMWHRWILYTRQTDLFRGKYSWTGWLGGRVVSVLDSGAEGPRFKSHPRRCQVTVLGKLLTPIMPLVAALLRVVGVTSGLVESNHSLPTGVWLTSPACWLSRTGISYGTLRSVLEYGQPLPFLLLNQ